MTHFLCSVRVLSIGIFYSSDDGISESRSDTFVIVDVVAVTSWVNRDTYDAFAIVFVWREAFEPCC